MNLLETQDNDITYVYATFILDRRNTYFASVLRRLEHI